MSKIVVHRLFHLGLLLLLLGGCAEEWKNLPALNLTKSLNGTWLIRFDPENHGLGEGWMNESAWTAEKEIHPVQVPGVFESLPEGAGYDGVAWYMRRFTLPPGTPRDSVVVLRFGSVNHAATVFIDGNKKARHEGGYTAFEAVVNHPDPSHEYLVVVRVVDPGEKPVDGLTLLGVPHAKESWYYNFGGITGDVTLAVHGPIRVKDIFPALTAPAGIQSPGENQISFTLENLADESADTLFRLKLIDPVNGSCLFEEEDSHSSLEGQESFTWDLGHLDALKVWSLDSPRLYEVEVLVEGGGYTHGKSVVTGARIFELGDEGFLLNGNPFFVRAVLYQPYYPGTLALPPNDEWTEREVAQIREAGFNMVRAHVRPAPEAFLRACDRQGLLVMAEPAIGWIKEQTPQTEARVRSEVEGLIRAGRNHPSIVWWGMLNELSGCVFPFRTALMDLARSLDPSRLVTDDSGGMTGVSLYMPPYETECRPYLDAHLYYNYPLDADARKNIRDLGTGKEGPAFVSEFGSGGMADLEAVREFFEGSEHLEDGAEYAQYLEEAEADLERTALGRVFSSFQDLLALANRVQSEAALVIGAECVNNPRVAGYCYTQYQGVSWELGAGIVDILGRPKPAFEALKVLNALQSGQGPPLPEPIEIVRPHDKSLSRRFVCPVKLPARAAERLKGSWPAFDFRAPEPPAGPGVVVAGEPLSLLKRAHVELDARLFRFVKDGGVLLYLRPPRLDGAFPRNMLGRDQEGLAVDLPLTLHSRRCRGGFIGKFHYVDPGAGLLEGLEPMPNYLGIDFGGLVATEIMMPLDDVDYQVPLGAFDCYGRFVGGEVLAVPYGRGWFVFSHLRLLENLDTSPLAGFLLERIVSYSLGLAKGAPEGDKDFNPPGRLEASRLTMAMQRVRRVFGFIERLSLHRHKGKKYLYPPELFALDRVRLEALEALAGCRYGAATEILNRLADSVPEEWTGFMALEMKFVKAHASTPATTDTKIEKDRAARLYEAALSAFARGEHTKAIDLLERALK